MKRITHRTLRLLGALALGAALGASSHAQPLALRSDAVGAGATDASGGSYTLRGTVGQAADGRRSGGAYLVAEGFWPTTEADDGGPPGLPPISFQLTPTSPTPPVIVAQGETFTFDATTTVGSGGPAQFTLQYWSTVRLPNGNLYPPAVFGPVTVNLRPDIVGTSSVTQQVRPNSPVGTYTYIMQNGTFPDEIVAADSFEVAVVASGAAARGALAAAPIGSGAKASAGAASSRVAAPSEEAVPSEPASALGPWLAFDASGARLEPGDVVELLVVEALADEATPGADPAAEEASGAAEAAAGALSGSTADVPEAFALHAAYPNPFATTTTLRFDLPKAAEVRVTVYDVLGREVTRLVDAPMEPGAHRATLQATDLPSGTYLVRMTAGDGFAQTQRLTLLR